MRFNVAEILYITNAELVHKNELTRINALILR